MFASPGISRVLVVDDEPHVRSTVATALTHHGCEVHVAEDVDQALLLAESNAFSCAVVDWQLHWQTGLPILEALRSTQPECARILMTGRSSGEVFVEAVRSGGVTDIVRKPFSHEELLSTVDRAMRDQQRQVDQDTKLWNDTRENLEHTVRHELAMALQPIVDDRVPGTLRGRRVVAYEALLRSRNTLLNNPPALLTAAERLDRVVEVGSRALLLASRRVALLPPDVKLFVNLHPAQLSHRDLLERDLELFADHPERIVFEITERSPLEDIVFTLRTVDMIRDRGFAIAVDDLGAGYSSLAMVADLEPQYVKLDMSLIRNLHQSPRRKKLVQLLQRFGEAEGTMIVAEGVEAREELDALRDCGIRLMQGYFFARPTEGS